MKIPKFYTMVRNKILYVCVYTWKWALNIRFDPILIYQSIFRVQFPVYDLIVPVGIIYVQSYSYHLRPRPYFSYFSGPLVVYLGSEMNFFQEISPKLSKNDLSGPFPYINVFVCVIYVYNCKTVIVCICY